MKTNKNGLDEMQRGKRNSIGNQMFMLIFYALLVDCGLYGAGVRWLSYPANIMVIIMVCMGIYLVRSIAANAYLPPQARSRKTAVSLIIAIVFAVALAIAAFKLFEALSVQPSEAADDHSALILFIVSAVGLLVSLIAAIIKKVADRDGDDE